MNFDFVKDVIHNLDVIDAFIHAQSYIILGLTFYTAIILKGRIFFQSRYKKYDKKYSDILIDEVFMNATIPDYTSRLELPAFWKLCERKCLKRALMYLIARTTSTDRAFIISLYEKLGYAQKDANLTIYLRWNKRLEGVTNLSYLKLPKYAPYLVALLDDNNELVAAAALLALSGTVHPKNQPHLLQKFGPRFETRKNILLEVAKNICAIHGIETLYLKLEKDIDPCLKDACVAAIISSKDQVRNIRLADLLKNKTLSIWAIRNIIEALTSVGDPSHEKIMNDFLYYPNYTIRLEAKKWIDSMYLNLQDEVS